MKWKKDKVQYIYEGKFKENGDFVNEGIYPLILGKLTE